MKVKQMGNSTTLLGNDLAAVVGLVAAVEAEVGLWSGVQKRWQKGSLFHCGSPFTLQQLQWLSFL